jgi:hypothetical protein
MVMGIKKGTAKNIQAVAQAKALGVPDAAAFPAYAKRALRWSSAKRARKARSFQRKLGRRGGSRRAWRWKTKLQLLGVIEAIDRAEARGQLGMVENALRQPDTRASRVRYQRIQQREVRREAVVAKQPDPTVLYWALGGGVVVVAAAILLTGRQG